MSEWLRLAVGSGSSLVATRFSRPFPIRLVAVCLFVETDCFNNFFFLVQKVRQRRLASNGGSRPVVP